jgi:hypothetical protein
VTIEEAINEHLRNYPGLVGNNVKPGFITLGQTLPAISYARVSHNPTQHRSSRRAYHSRDRFQFDVWASTYGGVVNTRNTLKDAMADFQRTSDPRVDVALIADDRDAYEAEPSRWRAIVDFQITYSEDD